MLLAVLWIPIVLLLCTSTHIASQNCNEPEISCTLTYLCTCTIYAANATKASDLVKQCTLSSVQLGITRFRFEVHIKEGNGTITLDIASGIETFVLIVHDSAPIEFTKTQTDISILVLSGTETSTLYCPNEILVYFPKVESFGLWYVALDRLSFQSTHLSQVYLYSLTLPHEVTIHPSLWELTPNLAAVMLFQSEDAIWYKLSPNSFDDVERDFISLSGIQHLYNEQFASVTGLIELSLSGFFSDFTFEENALAGLNEVEILIIYKLPNFDLLAKQTFPSLREFTLEDTDIITLEQEFFARQKALMTISVPYNPFHCDCEMAWLSYVSTELGWTVTGTCDTPVNLKGNSIADSSNYISCSNKQSYNCLSDTFICPPSTRCANTVDSAYCD